MKLVIAEKPSVAVSIAKALNIKGRHDGYIENGDRSSAGEYIITWCIGHLVGLATATEYDEKYDKWEYEDLPIIPRDWIYTINAGKSEQFEIIKSLTRRNDVTEIVNACDAGSTAKIGGRRRRLLRSKSAEHRGRIDIQTCL